MNIKIKYFPVIFILLFATLSCKKYDFNIENLNNNKIMAIGHGGMGIQHIYPMNSYESIMNCLNLESDGTEVDVQITKDNVMVAFHDFELGDKTKLKGHIYQKTWAEIENNTYNDLIYTNYTIISLDILFNNIAGHQNKHFFLDFKTFNPDTSAAYINTFCNTVFGFIDKYNLTENVHLELKRTDIIKALKQKRPELKIFIYALFDEGIEIAENLDLTGLSIDVNLISKEQIRFAHSRGKMVSVFNAKNKSGNMDAINKNADFIQTDNLPNLLKVLKK